METKSPLEDQKIVLGVCGGIAAYKSVELVRRLTKAGAEVRVIMTGGGQAFVTPLTFQAVSGNPVHVDLLDEAAEAGMGHIELARWADQILVAPASANFMARLAHGMADDLLTTVCLATASPVIMAPAMNQQMWANAATLSNRDLLASRGVRMIGPDSGSQACGETGPGRMTEPEAIVEALMQSRGGALDGKRVLVTAGPTFEDIDPVRFIGNRSSGRMGFAIAEAARVAGAEVTLVAGPVGLQTPSGVDRLDVRSAVDMHGQVMSLLPTTDIFISVAAVADYRPSEVKVQKIKKDSSERSLHLVPNPDIVADVAAQENRPFTVGFAAETENVIAHAREKLSRKGLDMIAANHVGCEGSGFESDTNEIVLLTPDSEIRLGKGSKLVLAHRMMEVVARSLTDEGNL